MGDRRYRQYTSSRGLTAGSMRLLLCLCLLALVSCSSPAVKERPNYNQYLKIAFPGEPQTFNPLVITDAVSSKVSKLLFDGLTRMNGETYVMEPSLARHWECSEDGLTWTFYLRSDVKWSDGEAFDADDVLFTLQEVMYDPRIPVSVRDGFQVGGQAIQWSKLDALTVQAHLAKPFASFVRQLALPIVPEHLLRDLWQQGQLAKAWGTGTDPRDIVGTGPFRLTRFRVGEHLVFTRNELFWRKDENGEALPYLEGLIAFVIPDSNAALLRFERGELDVLGLSGEHWTYLSKRNGSFDIYELGPSWGTQFLTLHLQDNVFAAKDKHLYDWFSKTKFRQALSFVLNRERMIKQLMYGQAYAQYGPLSVANKLYYEEKGARYPHNPAQALALLQSEGFVLNEGQLHDSQGRPVRFKLMVGSESLVGMNLAHMIQHDFKQIGIELVLNPVPFSVMIQKVMQNQDWQAMLLGLTGGVDPYGGKNVWTSPGHLHFWNLRPEQIFAWETRIDQIFAQAEGELDLEKRQKLYSEWQQLVAKELPLIYTVIPASLFAVHFRIKGETPSSLGGILHNVITVQIADNS